MRQYQSFRLEKGLPARPFTGGMILDERSGLRGLGAMGDMGTAAYRDPKGGPEILTKTAFTEKYGFEPTEDYLVGDPQYNTPDKTPEVLRGAQSLPYVRPDLFEKRAWRHGGGIKTPGAGGAGAPGAGGPGGAPPGGPPGAPPGSPPVTEIIPPPAAEGRTVTSNNSAIATAYGGQSIINIAYPGSNAMVGEGGASGDAFSAPAIYGTASPSDLESPPPPEGFLSLITPKTNNDWLKVAVGVAAGVAIGRWLRKKAR